MEEKELPELIDEYLLGHIRDKDLARLEYLRMTKPDIDLRVNQSIETFRVIQYARYQQLRQRLHQIDALDKKTANGSRHRRLLVAGVFFIISLLSIWLWVMEYYSPVSLAARYFEPLPPAFLWNEEINDEDARNWKSACRTFSDGDFQTAISLFQPFLDDHENIIAYYAQWNILLARLGLGGYGLYWREEIRQFETVAPEPMKSKAAKLLHIIDSPFYQIIVLRVSPQLSALKPRLM